MGNIVSKNSYAPTIIRTTWAKTLYTPELGEHSGVLTDSMIKVYLGYRNTY